MGLLDFLKKKETAQIPQAPAKEAEKQPYLGDLEKTALIDELLKQPADKRDGNWDDQFLQYIKTASFRCGDPQVITGPDGMPYFQLLMPEPNQNFQCFVIDNMKDDFLMTSGIGVAINPSTTGVDWVLSYGDIVNYALSGEFYHKGTSIFSKETKNEVIEKDEEVMVGAPHENILPLASRKIIANFLKQNGIENPKVAILMRRKGTEPTQDLVFNVTPQSFPDEETYRSVMATLAWFLPRHYTYIGMSEKTIADSFIAL
jgi:hypothetical protein